MAAMAKSRPASSQTPASARQTQEGHQNATHNWQLAATVTNHLSTIKDPSHSNDRLFPQALSILLERQFLEIVELLRNGYIRQPAQNSDVELWIRPQRLRASVKGYFIGLLRGEAGKPAEPDRVNSARLALHGGTDREAAVIAAWTGLLGNPSKI
jgi:hypothetical protein